MINKTITKLLGGTIARGILWAAAALATKLGIDGLSEDTATSVGYFAAAAILAGISAVWSKGKDKKLLDTPAEDTPVENDQTDKLTQIHTMLEKVNEKLPTGADDQISKLALIAQTLEEVNEKLSAGEGQK